MNYPFEFIDDKRIPGTETIIGRPIDGDIGPFDWEYAI